ncbi:hypothetical protein DICPUDRAFT_30182 [Dictyostelium purpureum]|uniref:Phosphatidylethanolamine-binding protein n=1 Tax=Dictyostelium purpureum TaxID=5786 RepID=F0ZEX6_DICPU|nr:uncharacterized protein DICPUDRAFT_30182 [Dictyostelium purpureum]EGC37506.1 hypothetical protein DICPUDRAFT_30182 [Dictyostelium purpureum]|eukprot:XP_003285980.1 hypothetical protein DICPUDRAFT_30182 [Dictyostelium purpureum]
MTTTLHEEIKKMETNEIIPQIVKSVPCKKLIVKYGIREMDLGDVITPTAAKDKPTLVDYVYEKDQFYTLILIDADDPSRTNRLNAEVKHWILVNIKENNVNKGEHLVQYLGPTPPVGTFLHRYIFILCKQPSKLDFKGEYKIPFTLENRKNWSSDEFIKKWDLIIEGINYFECQYDDQAQFINEKLIESQEESIKIK